MPSKLDHPKDIVFPCTALLPRNEVFHLPNYMLELVDTFVVKGVHDTLYNVVEVKFKYLNGLPDNTWHSHFFTFEEVDNFFRTDLLFEELINRKVKELSPIELEFITRVYQSRKQLPTIN